MKPTELPSTTSTAADTRISKGGNLFPPFSISLESESEQQQTKTATHNGRSSVSSLSILNWQFIVSFGTILIIHQH